MNKTKYIVMIGQLPFLEAKGFDNIMEWNLSEI